jgi:hypothetical protein
LTKPPPQKKKTKFYQTPNLAFVFFSKNREDGTCHKAYIVGGTIGQIISYGRVASPHLLSPPKKTLFLVSWPQHKLLNAKSPPCPANLRISPQKKEKKENCFCLYCIITNSHM